MRWQIYIYIQFQQNDSFCVYGFSLRFMYQMHHSWFTQNSTHTLTLTQIVTININLNVFIKHTFDLFFFCISIYLFWLRSFVFLLCSFCSLFFSILSKKQEPFLGTVYTILAIYVAFAEMYLIIHDMLHFISSLLRSFVWLIVLISFWQNSIGELTFIDSAYFTRTE